MTALIWMLAWLPQVLSAMSKRLPQPVNVTLTSRNFIHVLKWEPGPGTPPGVHYHVTYSPTKRPSWVPVVGCQHVQHPLVCNLSDAFTDPREEYVTLVKAKLGAQISLPASTDGFRPDRDTDLDLPLLKVTACGEGLCVDLRPPRENLRNFYNSLTYKLKVESNTAENVQNFVDVSSLKNQTLKDLALGRRYCVSVRFSDTLTSRKSNFSQPVCAFTLSRVTADSWISGVLCFLVLSGVLVLALLVYMDYTCLTRRPLPSVLTSIYHREDFSVVLPSCSLSVRSAHLITKTTLPSAGRDKNYQTSDDSDEEETNTQNTGWSKGGGYKTRVGNSNLISSSSSSSSSSLASPQNKISTNSQSNAELNTDCEHSEKTQTHQEQEEEEVKEEEEVLEEEERQDVNLLTLTVSTLKNEDWTDVNSSSSSSVVYNTNPTQTKETMRTVYSFPGDEEEEEEEEDYSSGYMQRPNTSVMKNFL